MSQIDNDIKNELLELANLVTQEFSNSENDTPDLKYESFRHENTNLPDENVDNTDKIDDDDVISDDLITQNDVEFKPPEVDWKNLEIKLKQAQQEIHTQNKRASIHNDREEIRRKLAMVSSSSSSSSFTEQNQDNLISDYLRRPSATKNNLIGQNLQICFMNELADDLIDETLPEPLDQVENETSNNMVNSTSSFSLQSINSNDSCDTILSQLQNETKQALAKVPNEVRFKMQSELVNKKPSPIADIVGLPTYGLKRLERENIVDMNIGQLQVIVNDLCNQIEKINEDLKVLLIDRDDLYMQQDSILVDIEDITKRIKEYAQKCKNSKENGDLISGTTHQKTCPSNGISAKLKSFVCNNHQQAAIMNTSDTTNSISSQKSKLFHLGTLKTKLYRFKNKN